MSGFARRGKGDRVTILVDGAPMEARAGESVALALLAAGLPLTAHCLMGVCCRCLCRIGGRPGELACQVTVTEGLEVRL